MTYGILREVSRDPFNPTSRSVSFRPLFGRNNYFAINQHLSTPHHDQSASDTVQIAMHGLLILIFSAIF